MISEKLLSEVLNEEVVEIFLFSKNTVGYYIKNNFNGNGKQIEYKINIHELDYKCKQWAWNQGYMLMSGQTLNSGWCCEVYSLSDNETTEEIFEDNRFIKTYYENFGGGNPVHQACEWIREQKAKS